MFQTLKIFRPCISKAISQHFGENKACVDHNGRVYSGPIRCVVSYYKSIGMMGHNGIDIPGLNGEDIYHAATFPGWFRSEADSSGGLGVDVVSNNSLFFPGKIPPEIINSAVLHTQNGVQGFLHHVKMRYWHLSMVIGHEGKQVTLGTVVGLMGNTGVSSGTHLHFAPKWCDVNGGNISPRNGYNGALDPTPYYNNQVTALEYSDMITKEALPLTPVEVKSITTQLSLVKKVVLLLQKLIHKI